MFDGGNANMSPAMYSQALLLDVEGIACLGCEEVFSEGAAHGMDRDSETHPRMMRMLIYYYPRSSTAMPITTPAHYTSQ